ncbi:MAG: hypothetical protein EPN88_16450, partial [Bacteroidetes bacterium]
VKKAMDDDMKNHPEIFLESIKVYCLQQGISDIYEILKNETRGKVLTSDGLSRLIQRLALSEDQKKEITDYCNKIDNPYLVKIVAESVQRTKKLFDI